MRTGYVGIDVAFAKKKRLPIVLCTWQDGRLIPEKLRRLPIGPPAGLGNLKSCDAAEVKSYAEACADYLRAIENALNVRIARIAIDAPRRPRNHDQERRLAEIEMDRRGISCFTTPSDAGFAEIREKVARHIDSGGVESRLPHANQLWMQVGFVLFEQLAHVAECIEVYPQAIVRAIGAGNVHKSRSGSAAGQLGAAARFTGWPRSKEEEGSLREIGWGPTHDVVDAYLAAWVAALEEDDRIPLGCPPEDVIWIPKT